MDSEFFNYFPFNCHFQASKTEELQDLMVDLEVKEAGFNNSFRETSEGHKEEIEVLVSKVESAKKEVSELHESLAKVKAEHATAVDEMLKTRKTEINSLQDEVKIYFSNQRSV